ncbi:DUF2207 domain-containing protein [Peptoniphilus equinus]|uniref:DUF2207 domain-containing protein n=1 Tax=Peptoniphilus equinus TaxID=3016343 RepID=A0ABY7QST3_9FIRM|nr:DUF2207 domain-containing protein [Peptoniphilus equinus]WBW49526.1 DUF2207 domain-containing protein [Peptoniphilus equinus]
MKKFATRLILTLVLAFSLSGMVHADAIDSIEIRAHILDDGRMEVTQVWQAEPTDGTEFYIPMNLGHMELTDFAVSDEDGPYTEMNPWNIDLSLEEKARHFGRNDNELNFGKTELAPKIYTLRYVLNNAVQNFSDNDGFNIRFVNDAMDPAPKRVKVTLTAQNGPITDDVADIWGFGYNGDVVFQDGAVVATSEDFSAANHLTLLIGFNKDFLHPAYAGSGDFAELKANAMDGSSYDSGAVYNDASDTGYGSDGLSLMPIILVPFFVVIIIMLIIMFIIIFGRTSSLLSKTVAKNYKDANKKDHLSRELPFHTYLPALYYLADAKGDKFRNFINAYFLKLMSMGLLEFSGTKKKPLLHLKADPTATPDDPLIAMFYENLLRAADGDSTLTPKEFTTYLAKFSEVNQLLAASLSYNGREYLLKNGYLTYERKDLDKNREFYLTPAGIEAVENIYGFKNFLKEFTLSKERTPMEVTLWEDILIGATALGVGETVLAHLEKFYPEFAEGNYQHVYTHYLTMSTFTSNAVSGGHASYSSSGSGGSASFGGGGGSVGGGSGGGSR